MLWFALGVGRGVCVMPQASTGIVGLRCPTINGLDAEIVHILHHSLTDLVRLRLSLKQTDKVIKQARKTIGEAHELLERLRFDDV